MSSSEAVLQLRIVTADFYSSSPCPEFDETYNHFRASVIKQIPIIRVFGITSTGEKACIHMHGVFPYIYIPYPNVSKRSSILYEVADSLDEALNNAFGSKKHYVSKVSTVSAKPFYGYHSKEKEFLKIEFYHPSSVKRSVSLLQAGAICNQILQPHEAHVPYILQFFIDYNLYGMNFLNLAHCTHRPVSGNSETSGTSNIVTKVTKCAVEVDACAKHILNLLSSSRVLNPGLAGIREEEERRHEEDGVSLEMASPEDYRHPQVTPSDKKFREELECALEERRKIELNNSQLSATSQDATHVTFDSEDISVLKVLLDRVVRDDLPDQDSVLGFTPEENPDEPELDLSQPYVSFIVDDNEEVISTREVDLSETLVWPELDGLSQIHCESDSPPLYVDGNMDDNTPEKKPPRKTRQNESPRYVPLDVKLHKSPKRKKSGKKNSGGLSSPEIFRKFELEVSSLRSITSPKFKVSDKKIVDTSHPSTSSHLDDDTDMICDSADSGTEASPMKFKYDFLEKTSKLVSSMKTKKKKKGAKRVLFDMTSTANSSTKVDSLTCFEDSNKPDMTATSTFAENSEPQTFEVNDRTSQFSDDSISQNVSSDKKISSSLSDAETNDADTTCYSQCTIVSFYGDTTLCPSPLDFNTVLTPLIDPPHPAEITSSLQMFGLEKNPTSAPFYGDPRDVSGSKEVGLNLISLKSNYANDLEEFKGEFNATNYPKYRPSKKRIVILEPAIEPPSSYSIIKELESFSETSSISAPQSQSDIQQPIDNATQFLNKKMKVKKNQIVELDRRKRQSGEIEHATPNNSGMFKLDFQNLQAAQLQTLHKYTTLMVLELHSNTRGSLRPDPEYDAVEAVFYVIANDVPSSSEDNLSLTPRLTGVIMVDPDGTRHQYPFPCSVDKVNTEVELFSAVVALVDYHNPDIIAGYEIEMLSWGYLIERGYVLGLNLMSSLSRLMPDQTGSGKYADRFSNKDYDLRIPGRIVLNVWRLMRHEVALMSYSFENVAYHVLHTRVPKFSYKTLTFWWNHLSKLYRHLVLKYYLSMVDCIEKVLDQLNIVGRTCELASLFGIQFYEVFSRGSQFRVESMMLRLVRRFDFVAVSPSVEQRAHMRAPESLPLIMEPESRFYTDPVIVLDFQSLYPSMIIAYNYCFSTCLGRVASLMESSEFKFGCTELNVPLKELLKLQKNIHVSPSGVAFVDKSIRLGVLPQMLAEILQTRLMVKASMKRHKKDNLLSRVLDARQLGLKLIANVTYGYTSANFSGRMPCIEIGDSVVSKGRETLERAIQLVEKEVEWRARVVYGDTDSMFVLCPGRSREEAFVIGQQIADQVTAANPSPVKLKLEKVYQPCILQTKKRYVGFMYESPDQKKAVYDAKGIETVRRDGCPAASKILEKSLKLLFEKYDMSVVKAYVVRQMVKVLSGRLNPAELTFAKEYRGISGYQSNAPVPALKIAKEEMSRDRRGEPRSGERVGYVVVCGPPGMTLISLVRSVPEFLSRPDYVLNADYYLSKAILPPLARCFTLLGADVFHWTQFGAKVAKHPRPSELGSSDLGQFASAAPALRSICADGSGLGLLSIARYSNVPKKKLLNLHQIAPGKRKATIAQYFRTVQCLACGSLTPLTLCEACHNNPSNTIALLSQTVNKLERKQYTFNKICESCCGRNYETDCVSEVCPIFYRRLQATNDCNQTSLLYDTVDVLSQF